MDEDWHPVRWRILHLPKFLVEIGRTESRTKAESLIKAAAVHVNNQPITTMKLLLMDTDDLALNYPEGEIPLD
jgi:predicted rRNA methylase YqxC with S4 and FtsJ domains